MELLRVMQEPQMKIFGDIQSRFYRPDVVCFAKPECQTTNEKRNVMASFLSKLAPKRLNKSGF